MILRVGVSFSTMAGSRQKEVSPRKCEERQSYSTPIPPHGRRWPIIGMVSPDSQIPQIPGYLLIFVLTAVRLQVE
jgi:hypothetical protein